MTIAADIINYTGENGRKDFSREWGEFVMSRLPIIMCLETKMIAKAVSSSGGSFLALK